MVNRIFSRQFITAMLIGAMTISMSACTHAGKTTGGAGPTPVTTPTTQEQKAPMSTKTGGAVPTTHKTNVPPGTKITNKHAIKPASEKAANKCETTKPSKTKKTTKETKSK